MERRIPMEDREEVARIFGTYDRNLKEIEKEVRELEGAKEQAVAGHPERRAAQRTLASEVTRMVHGEQALADAQRHLRASNHLRHPYYWAPFILMGNWNVRFGTHSDKDDSTVVKFKGISTWRKLLSM